MKHCERCQTELEDSANFCSECGMPQAQNEVPEKPAAEPPTPATPTAQAATVKREKIRRPQPGGPFGKRLAILGLV